MLLPIRPDMHGTMKTADTTTILYEWLATRSACLRKHLIRMFDVVQKIGGGYKAICNEF
jgi:hypothetical protein